MSSTVVEMTNTRDVLEDLRLRAVTLAGRGLAINAAEFGCCNRLDIARVASLGAGRSIGCILKGDISTTYTSWL